MHPGSEEFPRRTSEIFSVEVYTDDVAEVALFKAAAVAKAFDAAATAVAFVDFPKKLMIYLSLNTKAVELTFWYACGTCPVVLADNAATLN